MREPVSACPQETVAVADLLTLTTMSCARAAIDARLFGWKRIEISNANGTRKGQGTAPF
jgi:hypothetical protein